MAELTKEDKKLKEDSIECYEEIKPILAKYNLVVSARMEYIRNGVIALPELVRPKEKKQ